MNRYPSIAEAVPPDVHIVWEAESAQEPFPEPSAAAGAALPRRCLYTLAKPSLEYLTAAILLVLLAPAIAIAAILIKLTSPGPAFFRQTRVGKGGREFRVWKIRTMVVDAEAATGPIWSVGRDPRVTPLGHFLRQTHIDEFPQLFNVLAGDMALVGPRPERPEFVVQLDWQLEGYRQRLNVKPGITGLAQVLLPPDSDLESVRRKLAHDLYYIRNLTFWLDLRILLHTTRDLISVLAAAAVMPLRLPTSSDVLAGSGPVRAHGRLN
jgi:lipopolysaccharide/colanic/teichoic acid biosynthesis glycosyltransferase